MDPRIEDLVAGLADGSVSEPDALAVLRDYPTEDLGFARLDHHRTIRQGFPEVVFGEGKTTGQIVEIVDRLRSREHPVLVTRLAADAYEACADSLDTEPGGHYDSLSQTWTWQAGEVPVSGGTVVVACAGTSDLPVAEEAAITAEVFGNPVQRVTDVGVAGLHRLLDEQDALQSAGVIIAVAGMEGALPSVIGGLVSCPVIAVPTSVGYGASFDGVAALLAMLNSCASGVTVVNIDNGFGAACAATRINQAIADS